MNLTEAEEESIRSCIGKFSEGKGIEIEVRFGSFKPDAFHGNPKFFPNITKDIIEKMKKDLPYQL